NHDVFFEVDVQQLNFAHAMALECQLLDTFTDYADFSQPQNFYLQTAYLRIFGEFYRHQVPDAKWVQHPADRWLHPGIQLPDGDVGTYLPSASKSSISAMAWSRETPFLWASTSWLRRRAACSRTHPCPVGRARGHSRSAGYRRKASRRRPCQVH